MSTALRAIHDALAGVDDPELPISIVDLGLIDDVQVDDNHEVTVTLLPTFTGCPALDMIARDVEHRVTAIDSVRACHVRWIFEPAWTTERISKAGRAQLQAHGVTVPGPETGHQRHVPLTTSVVPCPFCASKETRLDSPFGPTRCRMIYYCTACQHTFEHMKQLDR